MPVARSLAAAACIGLAAQGAQAQGDARRWDPVARDGIHDPRASGVPMLQEPAEALRTLPADTAGNQVRWVDALERGLIAPRSRIEPSTEVRLRETTIVLDRYGATPRVSFPHRAHTLWLDCSNCHEKLFVSKAGANDITMSKILQGEQCGRCHGAVAFPLTECRRCHNTPVPAAAAPAPQGRH